MNKKKIKRIKRVRSKISGSGARPRLAVFRSSKHIYGQLIDDEKRVTLASSSSKEIKDAKGNLEAAKEVGKTLAKKAKEKKVNEAVFDRRFYKYHGRVKALAEGAREEGLKL